MRNQGTRNKKSQPLHATAGPTASAPSQAIKSQLAEVTADLQRVQADFVNYKRRAEEDLEKRVILGQQLTITRLLATLDNLTRALAGIPEELKGNPWAQGVEQTAGQLSSELAKLGLEKIIVVGEHFDPELMDAALVEGEGEEEIVVEELQAGYKLNDSVLRHAVVKVERR